MKNSKSIGIIGLGKMGEAILTGLQNTKSAKSSEGLTIGCTTRSAESAEEVSSRLKVKCTTDNRALVRESEVLILCVKPHQAEEVVSSIAEHLTSKHLIISICASITTQQIRKWSNKKAAVIRAMPNTPCLIGEGMTVYCSGQDVEKAHLDLVFTSFWHVR
jgi:pyrroline-5-carboxylate reductase